MTEPGPQTFIGDRQVTLEAVASHFMRSAFFRTAPPDRAHTPRLGYLSGSPKSQDQKIFEHIVRRLGSGPINPFERQAPEDELTPRDRGVLIGHLVAKRIAQGDLLIEDDPPKNARSRLRLLVRYTPPAVDSPLYEFVLDGCGVSERLAESEDPDAEQAFWGGFSTGVRAYIAQTDPNKRRSDGFHRRAQ